jgi:hypothetical protein
MQHRLPIHAGVISRDGHAILLPIAGRSGTSTLMAELARRGGRCSANPFLLFDEEGRPQLANEPGMPPLPLVLVVATRYQAESRWEPVIRRGARALLPILDHVPTLRKDPAQSLRSIAALGSGVVMLQSLRPDAARVASDILEFADALMVARRARLAETHSSDEAEPATADRIRRSRRDGPESIGRPTPTGATVTACSATYTVGGLPRSGTSMMMRALAAGGLDVFEDPAKNENLWTHWERRREAVGYNPNPNGVHEPGSFRSLEAFPEMIRGRLVKLMGRGAAERQFARIGPIRVAYIYRNRMAVARSHLAAFSSLPAWTATPALYRQQIDWLITLQRSRPWIQDVTCIAYEDILRDPVGQFARLAEIGWPIDPRAAAAIVDSRLDRNSGTRSEPIRRAAEV